MSFIPDLNIVYTEYGIAYQFRTFLSCYVVL